MIEIYFFIVLAWCLLIIGLKLMKDYAMTMICSLLIMALGVALFAYGDFISFAFGIGHLGLGFYFSIRGSVELNKEPEQRINWKKAKWQNNKQKKQSQK